MKDVYGEILKLMDFMDDQQLWRMRMFALKLLLAQKSDYPLQ